MGIPLSRLSTTTTIIYGFNAENNHPLGKIRLRRQIGDLKSEVLCYVIDTDTSYNLLLGRPWIHASWIVPCTLHQCFKYMGDDAMVQTVFIEMVQTVFTEMQLFERVNNYFTDFLPYQENNKPVEQSLPDNVDSGNEANSESEEDAPATINIEPIVVYLDYFDCNNLTENEGNCP